MPKAISEADAGFCSHTATSSTNNEESAMIMYQQQTNPNSENHTNVGVYENDHNQKTVVYNDYFQHFDGKNKHTNAENYTRYKMSCEKHHLLLQCSKRLISIRARIIKGNISFNVIRVHIKYSQIDMKKMRMPEKKNLCLEVVRRAYYSNGTTKNARIRSNQMKIMAC